MPIADGLRSPQAVSSKVRCGIRNSLLRGSIFQQDTGFPTALVIFFVTFAVLFVGTFAFIIGATVYRWRAAKRSGLDPMAGDIQLMAAARTSQLLAPADPTARLAQLDKLLADGTISREEHAKARERILGEL